jgi:hypothetical protein
MCMLYIFKGKGQERKKERRRGRGRRRKSGEFDLFCSLFFSFFFFLSFSGLAVERRRLYDTCLQHAAFQDTFDALRITAGRHLDSWAGADPLALTE